MGFWIRNIGHCASGEILSVRGLAGNQPYEFEPRISWLSITLLLCFATFGQTANTTAASSPAELSLADAGLAIQHWGVEEGLPTETIFSLAQTRDGYLWIGTQNGLVRFNGYEFKVFYASDTPGLPRDNTSKLWADSQGRLWITLRSRQKTILDQGQFHRVGKGPGVTGDLFGPMTEDPQGNIWLLSNENGQLFRWNKERFELASPHRLPDEARGVYSSLITDRTGQLWGIWAHNRSLVKVTSAGLKSEQILTAKGKPPPQLGDSVPTAQRKRGRGGA